MNAPDAICSALYPPLEPYADGRLRLDSRHEMYWETSGNPRGLPVLLLHGGPGAGASAAHRRFFKPDVYNIVIFDQRGAGRSSPHADLTDNTTQHLIADIERLREHLKLRAWVLFGGSWGSTLALAYAQAFPDRCVALVLRGIFLCRQQEIDWFLFGMRQIFPEAWERFAALIPLAERGNLLEAYARKLTDPDPAVHLPAARSWNTYEAACSTLLPRNGAAAAESEAMALAVARIEAHFFRNRGFLRDDELLSGMSRLRTMPGAIVQGRYDVVCPVATAHELHGAWPQAEYIVVPDAGHSAWEPRICEQLVGVMDRLPWRPEVKRYRTTTQ
jgi:proline iminopeptidase